MNKLKYSLWGQMLLMVKTHLTTAILFMILFLATTSLRNDFGNIVFGVFGTLGYFLSIYSQAAASLTDDKRTISPLNPKPLKGFILPLILTAVSLVIVLMYHLAWAKGSGGQALTQVWSLILNIVSLLWVSPYQPFLGMNCGQIETYGYLIIFILPIIASGLGYFAAYKGFDLNAKIHGLAYEKKKDEF